MKLNSIWPNPDKRQTKLRKIASAIFNHQDGIVNLSNHNITDNDIENTLRYLNIFPSITNIDLSNNLIGNESAKAIITALEKNKKIEEINLNGNQNISPTYLNKLNELLPKPTPSENLPRCRCHIL